MKKTLAAAMAFSLITPLAMAQSGSALFTQEQFQKLDTNNDGRVSEGEYRLFMEDAFGKLDADTDGRLVPAEINITVESFTTADANRDGALTRQEFLDQAMRDFQRADTNNDGYLTYP